MCAVLNELRDPDRDVWTGLGHLPANFDYDNQQVKLFLVKLGKLTRTLFFELLVLVKSSMLFFSHKFLS